MYFNLLLFYFFIQVALAIASSMFFCDYNFYYSFQDSLRRINSDRFPEDHSAARARDLYARPDRRKPGMMSLWCLFTSQE